MPINLVGKIIALPLHSKYRGMEQLVARQAHNLEVIGSSPVPATKVKAIEISVAFFYCISWLGSSINALFYYRKSIPLFYFHSQIKLHLSHDSEIQISFYLLYTLH